MLEFACGKGFLPQQLPASGLVAGCKLQWVESRPFIARACATAGSSFTMEGSLNPTLTIVTFNIAHGRGLGLYQKLQSPERIRANLSRIGRLLRATGADVVALQEVDQASHWNWNIDLLEALREGGGFEYAQIGLNNVREGKYPLAYGNGILSHYPLAHWDNVAFGNATLGEKGFLYAVVQVGDRAVPIINLHLDFRSRRRRIAQVEDLIAYLTENCGLGGVAGSQPPIICGDFNSGVGREDDAVRHLLRQMLDHRDYKLYPRKARTFPAYWPQFGIDFILLPEPYQMLHCEVLPSNLSDHRPVLLQFGLPEGGGRSG